MVKIKSYEFKLNKTKIIITLLYFRLNTTTLRHYKVSPIRHKRYKISVLYYKITADFFLFQGLAMQTIVSNYKL